MKQRKKILKEEEINKWFGKQRHNYTTRYLIRIGLKAFIENEMKKKLNWIFTSLWKWMLHLILQACQYGHFGKDCSEKCDAKCTGCDVYSGLCDSGCQPGWKGKNCSEGIVFL